MKKWAFLSACMLFLSGHALEVAPWFGEIWEFHLRSNYTYYRFSHVQNGYPDLKHPWNTQLLAFSLEVPMKDTFDTEVEIEFAHTSQQSWGFRSCAGQFRYLLLDDVAGDPISLMVGANIRGVSHRSLRDISSPYHAEANFEVNSAVGKEWSYMQYWRMRSFAFAGMGIANRGSLWIRGLAAFEGNYQDRHQYQVFANTYWGFGPNRRVNIDHFNGYAKIHHQSIDLGAGYSYLFDMWGSLNLNYAFRVYAHSFPEYVNFFALTYNLPFSFF